MIVILELAVLVGCIGEVSGIIRYRRRLTRNPRLNWHEVLIWGSVLFILRLFSSSPNVAVSLL